MEEKDLIKQLKLLKSIKPNKDWVGSTKQGIFANAPDEATARTPGFITTMASLFERRALAFSVAAFVVLAVIGGFFYFTTHENNIAYETLEGLLAEFASESKTSQEMLSSLNELQAKLSDVTMAVDNLKRAKDQGGALAMTEVVKTTANEGRDVMQRIKKVDGGLSKQVLASLTEVELRAEELGQKSYGLQKEIFASYLKDLKQRALSPQDQERLERAEELYEQGREAEAMILMTRIGNR